MAVVLAGVPSDAVAKGDSSEPDRKPRNEGKVSTSCGGGKGFKAGKPLSRPQNFSQKSNACATTSPRSSTHPSNQSSQLTLQLGMNNLSRSRIRNLECITLKGKTKILRTVMSSPWSSDGSGNP